jgi:hypothetical protein
MEVLGETKLFDCGLGNLFGIADARRADLNDLAGDDVCHRIVAINEVQLAQGVGVGPVQPLDLFRPQIAAVEQPIDRHLSPIARVELYSGYPTKVLTYDISPLKQQRRGKHLPAKL